MMRTVLSLLIFCAGIQQSYAAPASSHFKKVVYIVLENTDYSGAVKQSDLAGLVSRGALFTNFLAEAHPSQPNYIAMISGSTLGVKTDSNVNLDGSHVGDLLEKANLDWRVYAENFPSNCFTGSRSGNYVRKHNPFMSFTNVSTNARRCQKIESADRFDQDLASGNLPEFSFYVPNLQNDGHDTDVDFAGKWLTQRFSAIFTNPQKLNDILFVITFDESEVFSPKNQIFTLLLGASVKAGIKNNQAVNHTSILRLIEDEFGIGNLGRDDARAVPIQGIWQ